MGWSGSRSGKGTGHYRCLGPCDRYGTTEATVRNNSTSNRRELPDAPEPWACPIPSNLAKDQDVCESDRQRGSFCGDPATTVGRSRNEVQKVFPSVRGFRVRHPLPPGCQFALGDLYSDTAP